MGKEGAFFPDWDSRIKHPASHWCHEARGGTLPRPAPAFEVKEAKSGDSYRADSWTVHTQSVQHVEPYLESLAFRFETSAGSVVFAGDCADCPDLRDFAAGADTLVAACTHFGPSETDPAISEVITGSSDTAEIAAEADVNTLVLTHANSRFAQAETQEKVIAEIRETFDGAVFFPEELTTVSL
jgi:ribonuclease BN (tRNA processing enzyme)